MVFSFSLRYLQFESRVLPSIESLPRTPSNRNDFHSDSVTSSMATERNDVEHHLEVNAETTLATSKRSGSLNTLHYNADSESGDGTLLPDGVMFSSSFRKNERSSSHPKLPTLLNAPKIAASHDNREYFIFHFDTYRNH